MAADPEAPDPGLLPLPLPAADAHPADPPLHGVLGVLPPGGRALHLRRLAAAAAVPLYDHDRLGPCFFEITHILEMLSEKIVASRYIRVEFMVRDDLLVANLLPEWLAPETEFSS